MAHAAPFSPSHPPTLTHTCTPLGSQITAEAEGSGTCCPPPLGGEECQTPTGQLPALLRARRPETKGLRPDSDVPPGCNHMPDPLHTRVYTHTHTGVPRLTPAHHAPQVCLPGQAKSCPSLCLFRCWAAKITLQMSTASVGWGMDRWGGRERWTDG